MEYVRVDFESLYNEALDIYQQNGGDILFPGDEKEILLRSVLAVLVQERASVNAAIAQAHGYTSGAFAAPKRGIYQFTLRGSGGTDRTDYQNHAAGGQGGLTVGYLLLEAGQTVYVGCGGPCSAAWTANASPGNAGVAAINLSNLLFVAGAGGGGGTNWSSDNKNGPCGTGGAGGGSSGADGSQAGRANVGCGGTQSKGGAGCDYNGYYVYLGKETNPGSYGTGSISVYTNNGSGSGRSGDGGDGYYGGGAGASFGNECASGGGGSGYVYAATLTVGTRSYACSTAQGGGAASNTAGSVTVTYAGPAELPVAFDGTRITALFFNGTAVDALVYNGTKVFAQRALGLYRRTVKAFARRRAVMA